MKDSVALITGGTSGVGLSLVNSIAGKGGRVMFVGHNRKRGLQTEESLKESTGNDRIVFLEADLGDSKDVRRLAEEVGRRTDRLDIFSYNAGTLSLRRLVTAEGVERTFAVNYLGFYALSLLLSPLLVASAPSRILSVSGGPRMLAHTKLNLAVFSNEPGYNGVSAAVQAALAKVLCTFELSKKLSGTGVTANTFHPGLVRSGLGSHLPVFLHPAVRFANLFLNRSTKTGTYAALSEEIREVTGVFLASSHTLSFCNKKTSREEIEKLMALSAELSGVQWR